MGGPIDTRVGSTSVDKLAEDRGIDWFKSLGVPPDPNNPRDAGSYGPKLYCISGHVNKPEKILKMRCEPCHIRLVCQIESERCE